MITVSLYLSEKLYAYISPAHNRVSDWGYEWNSTVLLYITSELVSYYIISSLLSYSLFTQTFLSCLQAPHTLLERCRALARSILMSLSLSKSVQSLCLHHTGFILCLHDMSDNYFETDIPTWCLLWERSPLFCRWNMWPAIVTLSSGALTRRFVISRRACWCRPPSCHECWAFPGARMNAN